MSHVYLKTFLLISVLMWPNLVSAAVVTIEGTVKSVDAKKRTITVEVDGDSKTLDVSRKAKVSVKGKTTKLDSLKAGQKVKLSYHDELEIVLRIEADGGFPNSTKPDRPELPNSNVTQGDVVGVHDPCVIKDGDAFYLFSTGGRLAMRRSHDMVSWEKIGPTLPEMPDWARKMVPMAKGCWAPDISYFAGEYHLFYSVSTFGSNHSCIGHATSATLNPESPNYKWVDQGMVVRSRSGQDNYNAIDPNVVLDEDGQPWLSFGSFWSGIKLVRLDLTTGQKTSRMIDIAGRNGGAIEAPFIVRHGRWFYLFVSFDKCCKGVESTYKVMVGRARKVSGPYVDFLGKKMTDGGGTLVLAGYKNVRGPGHNAVLSEGGKDYFVHHFYNADSDGRPTLQIRPLLWDKDDWPLVGEPLVETSEQHPIRRKDISGVWEHSVDFRTTGRIQLQGDGSIGGGKPSWKFGGKGCITFRWPRSDAPNGAWIDECFVSSDGEWYAGRNQQGMVIRGLRLR